MAQTLPLFKTLRSVQLLHVCEVFDDTLDSTIVNKAKRLRISSTKQNGSPNPETQEEYLKEVEKVSREVAEVVMKTCSELVTIKFAKPRSTINKGNEITLQIVRDSKGNSVDLTHIKGLKKSFGTTVSK